MIIYDQFLKQWQPLRVSSSLPLIVIQAHTSSASFLSSSSFVLPSPRLIITTSSRFFIFIIHKFPYRTFALLHYIFASQASFPPLKHFCYVIIVRFQLHPYFFHFELHIIHAYSIYSFHCLLSNNSWFPSLHPLPTVVTMPLLLDNFGLFFGSLHAHFRLLIHFHHRWFFNDSIVKHSCTCKFDICAHVCTYHLK